MLFNSLNFAIFFVLVYRLYLLLNHKWQNRMLLVVSCIFYGAWDWRFLFLMFTSITTDFFCAKYIYKSTNLRERKILLVINLVVNLGILGFFKYFNFFENNLQALLHLFGFSINIQFLHIILPIGISFYTFQAISYAFDVYRNKLVPTKSYPDYALFVTFFPQLVAGPIMRAKDLLPQIINPRMVTLNKFYEGCYFIFWGLFQKVFVADNLAKIVDPIFASSSPYNGVTVLLGLYAFAFQIYCDFAGYSNIARGLGKCMGFDIMVNFNLPYFATNSSELWKRWHISFSTWLRDYLYIPLGGNRKGSFLTYRNLAITMLLGGLWHGAAWTFVIWGAYQGIILIIHRLLKPFLEKIPPLKNILLRRLWFFIRVIFFFQLICLGWLIFRSREIKQIYYMLKSVFFNFHFEAGTGIILNKLVFFTIFLVAVELSQYARNDQLVILKLSCFFRVCAYLIIFYSIVVFGVNHAQNFIYFQF